MSKAHEAFQLVQSPRFIGRLYTDGMAGWQNSDRAKPPLGTAA